VALVVVVGCVIEKEGKILLVQEGPGHRVTSARGTWNIPAGRVEAGTAIFENALREVKEEAGYDVELDDIVGIYENLHSAAGDHVIRINFRAHIVGGKPKFDGNEIADVKWFTPEEILAMPANKLRGIRETVEDFVKGHSLPLSFIGKYR
jgi:ADP-ribose pyrophosphatase YjhB (NUDIX family)